MSRIIRAVLVLLIAAASAWVAVGGATAQGITPETLVNAGWTCFTDPGDTTRTVCSDPGHGRPFPGNPDAPPSYNFKIFQGGSLLGTSHLIRADLYRDQPCPPSGELYFFIPPIGYYRCEHF
jgi:hypothetical protein